MTGKITEALISWGLGGKKQVYMLRTGVDGELFQLAFDGLFGRRGILDVLRVHRMMCRR